MKRRWIQWLVIVMTLFIFTSYITPSISSNQRTHDILGKKSADSPFNRKEAWSCTLPTLSTQWEYYTHPQMGPDGNIYTLSYSGFHRRSRVSCVSPDGKKEWSQVVGGKLQTPLKFTHEGRLYVAAYNSLTKESKLVGIDEGGSIELNITFPDAELFPPLVDKGSVYIASNDGKMSKYSDDGSLEWEKSVAENLNSVVKGPEDKIYLSAVDTSENYELKTVGLDGDKLWTHDMNGEITYINSGEENIYVYSGKNVSSYKIKMDSPVITAIGPEGTVEWSYELKDEIIFSSMDRMRITNSGLYFVTRDKFSDELSDQNLQEEVTHIYRLNKNGEVGWKKDIYEGSTKLPTDLVIGENGVIYGGFFSAKSGVEGYTDFYAMDKDGQLRWTYDVGEKEYSTLPTVDSDGTLYVISGDAEMYCYEERFVIPFRLLLIAGIAVVASLGIFVIVRRYGKGGA